MINQLDLKRHLFYCPKTGGFIWLNPVTNAVKRGDKAGGNNGLGYIRIRLKGKRYMAHRLAWMYMKGEWPKHEIDHINGNGLDNRWHNLREATPSQNSSNQKERNTNTLGVKGVTKYYKKYIATICKNGVSHQIGRFDSLKEAKQAYIKASIEYHGEYSVYMRSK